MNDEKQFVYFLKENLMKESVIKLDTTIPEGQYRAWYRCSNCGVIFQHDLNKGLQCTTMAGICPLCGVKSGTAGTGVFPIIKFNPEQDQIPQRHYFK